MILITSSRLYRQLDLGAGISFYDSKTLQENWGRVRERLAAGEGMAFVGTENSGLLEELWIFTAPGRVSAGTRCEWGSAAAQGLRPGEARYLYVRPPHRYALSGIDEQPRMSVVPLWSDYDGFGGLLGHPALLLKHEEASLTGSRFRGGFWFIWAVEDPCAVLDSRRWSAFLREAASYADRGLFLAGVQAEYPLYYGGEPVRIDYRVTNTAKEPKVYTVTLRAYREDGSPTAEIGRREGAVSGGDTAAGRIDWYPGPLDPGVYRIAAELSERDRMLYGIKRETTGVWADSAQCGILAAQREQTGGPAVELSGRNLTVGGDGGFLIGTHLYPSSNFFELSYRPVEVLRLLDGVKAMRAAGVRICRIWCDPILDETSLRGMECVVDLLGRHGIAVIFTFFSSWTHEMEINLPEASVRFEVAHMTDERLIGLYMKHAAEQKLLVSLLARRWKRKPHIIWDFSNEFSVVDPDEKTHLNVEWLDAACKAPEYPERNSELFRRWALMLQDELRAHAPQAVIYGVSCWNTGADTYLSTKDADLIVDHGYYELEDIHPALRLTAAECIRKPLMLEEFGGVWPEMSRRAEEYDLRYHYYLGAEACAALNYEWGVLWLSRSLSGMPAYMKFMDEYTLDTVPDYCYKGRFEYAKTWTAGSLGLCPWMASFEYGNNYPCTETRSEAMLVMLRTAQLGEGLELAEARRGVYLVLPYEREAFRPHHGYPRRLERIARTVRLLHRHGVDFGVWQEDQIESLPAWAQTVIYPNEEPVRESVRLQLHALTQRGCRVFTGEDTGWLEIGRAAANSPQDGRTERMIRHTAKGILTVCINHDPEQKVLFSAGEAATEIGRCGSLLQKDGALLQAEFCGRVTDGGREILRSQGKCLARSNDGAGLLHSGAISLFPYAAGEVLLAGAFRRAFLVSQTGDTREILPEHSREGTKVRITADELWHEVRLLR